MSYAKAAKTFLNERKKPQYLNIDSKNLLEILAFIFYTPVENISSSKTFATTLNQLLKKNRFQKYCSCGFLLIPLLKKY